MSWLAKLIPERIRTNTSKKGVPEGVWSKCDSCGVMLYQPELERNLFVCPKCDHHFYLSARQRLAKFLDQGSTNEIAAEIEPTDKLKFKDSKKYRDRLSQMQKKTGERDALVAMSGKLFDIPIVAAAFEYHFIGGSMGVVVGEKFVQAANYALHNNQPLVCFAASGGARMQEGLVSLLQMAKTSAVLKRLSDKRLPFISILTNPTMGGVSASLAHLGDIIIAEPNALIGFAGPRVIEQTVRQTLPKEFQRSEFLLEHGAIDMIIDRRQLRHLVAQILAKFLNTNSSAA